MEIVPIDRPKLINVTLIIDAATRYICFCMQGACVFVAVMLQYFFTSAFCWMLCEGVILYLMLVIVFSNRFNNRLFFFALGWGMIATILQCSCIAVCFQVLQYQ